MNRTTIDLFELWASRWEDLLCYRRDLIHWKKVLKTSEKDFRRTQLEAYRDEIISARYAIHQLECYIAELRNKLNSDEYSPYAVLQLPQDACAKAILHAYSRLRREAEQQCLKWEKLLMDADTQTKKVIFSNNLEKARFTLHQIIVAYGKLKPLKSYYPGVPHHKKLLSAYRQKHQQLKRHINSQILHMEAQHQ